MMMMTTVIKNDIDDDNGDAHGTDQGGIPEKLQTVPPLFYCGECWLRMR